jgi:hypothetical protein
MGAGMLPALGNLTPAAASPAAALLGSVTGAIGLWISGYIALSLSLGLCWILLVTFGRFYARKVTRTPDSRKAGPAVGLSLGLRFWRQPPNTFGLELGGTFDNGPRETLGNELRDLQSSLSELEPKGKKPAHPSPP